jgi:hypothetical protein
MGKQLGMEWWLWLWLQQLVRKQWGWNGGFGWNNWYRNVGAGTTGVGMAVLDGITGMATIGAGTIGDIQIIITTETMLITPAEEALLMQQ